MPVPDPHTAVPVRNTTDTADDWIEGERETTRTPVPGDAFHGSLFLPSPSEQEGAPRSRKVKRPQFIYEPFDDADQPIDLTAEDELDITAEELTGSTPVRWKLNGDPQPAGEPGFDPEVMIAYLVRVEDG